MRKGAYGALGAVALVAALEGVGRAGLAGKTWPPLSEDLAYIVDPTHRRLLTNALVATTSAAGLGALLGIIGGTVMAVVALQVPLLRPGLDRSAALAEAMPAIAIAPFLAVTLGRDATPMVIPAFGVGFIIYLSLSSGFAGVSASRRDVFAALGATRAGSFWRLEAPAALPNLFDGLTLAAPAAILGAMIGEFFGASRGLGVLVISAMQNFQTTLLWAAAILSVGVSLLTYMGLSFAHRRVGRRFV